MSNPVQYIILGMTVSMIAIVMGAFIGVMLAERQDRKEAKARKEAIDAEGWGDWTQSNQSETINAYNNLKRNQDDI